MDNAQSHVLARKYRPQVFADLIGQEALVKTITNAIATNRLAHAYMLTGIRGVGKTSSARIIAKGLNCIGEDGQGGMTPNPCGKCRHCLDIAADSHIDVIEIDAASNTGVDNVREIIEGAKYNPVSARFKIYIIDEVHMLSKQAFNALLKTLEEPPAHVIFILATTEIRKVPVTILSRCQRFDLVRVPIETLKKHFAWIAEQEKIELTDGANDLLARAADGSVRDGLSLLDQAIAQTGGHVDDAAVLDMLKRADRGVVVDLMKTMLSGDTAAALNKIDAIYNNGADLSMLLTDMMEWTHWATRMHPALNAGDVTNSPYTADQREQINSINAKITINTLSRIWQVMVAAVPEMQAAGNQKQCFDMLIIRCMHIANLPSVPDILKQQESENRVRDVKNILADRMAQTDAPVPQQKSQFIEIKSASDLANALQSAKEILLYSYYSSNIEVSEFSECKITYFDRKGDADFAHKLSVWLNDKTGKQWILQRETQSNNAHTISEQKQEELESDPLVASAMSLFEDAEIVGVK